MLAAAAESIDTGEENAGGRVCNNRNKPIAAAAHLRARLFKHLIDAIHANDIKEVVKHNGHH